MSIQKKISRSLRIAALVVLAGLCSMEPVWAQTGDDALRFTRRDPATGTRTLGMAGVGIAGIADVSALLSNPAGLGYFKRSTLSGGLHAFSTLDEAAYRVPGAGVSASERNLRETRLGNLAYAYKVPTRQGSFVVGVGFNQVNTFDRNLGFDGLNATNSVTDSFLPYDSEFEVRQDDEGYYPVFTNPLPELAYGAGAIEFLFENVGTGEPLFYQAVAPGTTLEQRGDLLEEGRVNELNLGGAIEAAPGVMAGLSANLSFGSYQFRNLFEEEDLYDETTEDEYEVILGDGSALGFDMLSYEQSFESDLTGFNLRGGVSARVTPALRVGFSLETPTYYSVSETYRSELTTFFDVGGSLSDEDSGSFEYQITSPWRLGGGAAFETGAFLVSADVEYVDWSQLELDADGDTFVDVNRTIRETLDPVFNTRLGGEYRFGALAVRAGAAYQPDPRQTTIDVGGEETNRAKTFLSAGVGYAFSETFHLDLGWIQERFSDAYRPYGDVATPPPAVEEEVVRNRLSLGFRVGF